MKHSYPRPLTKIIFLMASIATWLTASASITVDSVHVTRSTCPNNGTATIYARSTNPGAAFLYNIVSGPQLTTLQNSSQFVSLYPGTYTARVHDANSFDSAAVTFTISGNYTSPIVSANSSSPICVNSNSGQIVGHVQPGTGLPPYQWQMYSPYVGPLQQSDTFNNLAQGSYIIRLTDGCNVSRSVSTALDTGGTGLGFTSFPNYCPYIACGTVVFYGYFTIYKSKAYLPLTLTETVSTGTVTKLVYPQVADTTNYIPPVFYVADTITGVQFGGPFTISLTDFCDSTITYQPTTFEPFNFYFQPVSDTCGSLEGTIIGDDSSGWYDVLPVYDELPLHVTLQNAQTLQLVDSFTIVYEPNLGQPCFSCPQFQQQTPGQNFKLTVTDGCHNSSVQTFSWPSSTSVSCQAFGNASACRDSSGSAYFYLNGFGQTVNLSFLSGPPVAESSSPLFGYNNPMFYPATLNGLQQFNNEVVVTNVPPGFYTYTISDLCGHTLTDTFTMQQVVQLAIQAPVNSNCNGTSNINIILPYGSTYEYLYSLDWLDTLQLVETDQGALTAFNQLPGAYALSVGFINDDGVAIPGNAGCSRAIDYITVPNYNDSIIKSTYTAFCSGAIYLIVVADTTNGPPPFSYEVISGPQTFVPQSSGLFQVNYWSTYLVGAIDSCGNEDTRYVTVDTGRILPVVRAGGLCVGGAVTLNEVASPYFSYRWVTPDGHAYNGTSISINPFTAADTGLINITQYVNINGCIDSAHGTYHLAFNDTFSHYISLCANDTFWAGPNPVTQAGTYTFNLTGAFGCDSVVVCNVHMLPALHVTITATPVDSCGSGLTTLTGSGGTHYRWQPGNIAGQSIVVNAYYPMTYWLTVTDTGVCSATDSIVANDDPGPYIYPDTAYICDKTPAQLCSYVTGATYLWSNGATTACLSTLTPGNYTLTVTTTSGCSASGTNTIAPTPVPAIVQGHDTLYCLTTYNGYIIYQWYYNGNIINDATNYYYVPHLPGTYTCETLYDYGCDLEPNYNYVIININNINATATVSIYPNPTTGQLIITTQNFTPQSITIYDETGRLINTQPFKTEIDITPLSSGVYFVEVKGEEGVVRKRVVKM